MPPPPPPPPPIRPVGGPGLKLKTRRSLSRDLPPLVIPPPVPPLNLPRSSGSTRGHGTPGYGQRSQGSPEPEVDYSPSPSPAPPVPPKLEPLALGDPESPVSEDAGVYGEIADDVGDDVTRGLDMGDGIEAYNLQEQPTLDTRQYNLGAGPEDETVQGEYSPRGFAAMLRDPGQGQYQGQGSQIGSEKRSSLGAEPVVPLPPPPPPVPEPHPQREPPPPPQPSQPFMIRRDLDPTPTPTLHMYPPPRDSPASSILHSPRVPTPDLMQEITTLNRPTPPPAAAQEYYVSGGTGGPHQGYGPPSGQIVVRNQAPVGTGQLAIPKVALQRAVTQTSPREQEVDSATLPVRGTMGNMIQPHSFTGGVVNHIASGQHQGHPQGHLTLPGPSASGRSEVTSGFSTTIPRNPAPYTPAVDHQKIKVLSEAPVTPGHAQVLGIGDTGPPKSYTPGTNPWATNPGVTTPTPSDISDYSPRSPPTVIETRFSTMPLRSNLKGGPGVPGSHVTLGNYHTGASRKSVQFTDGDPLPVALPPKPLPAPGTTTIRVDGHQGSAPDTSAPHFRDQVSIVRVRAPKPQKAPAPPPPVTIATPHKPQSVPMATQTATQDGISIISVNTADGLEFGYPGQPSGNLQSNNNNYLGNNNNYHGNGAVAKDAGYMLHDKQSLTHSLGHLSHSQPSLDRLSFPGNEPYPGYTKRATLKKQRRQRWCIVLSVLILALVIGGIVLGVVLYFNNTNSNTPDTGSPFT